jgi:hypothetical protein
MILLLVLLLAGSPQPAAAERLHAAISVAPELRASLPNAEAIAAGVASLFSRAYGGYAEISFPGAAGADGAAAAGGAATSAPAEPAALVTIDKRVNGLGIASDLTQGGITRSLLSIVPEQAPASLVSTIAGDLAFLLFSLHGFAAFPLSAPPRLTGTLSLDALQQLTGWETSQLEPIGLAGFGDELTICFAHRYLTLGPLFTITAATLWDLHNQATGPEPLQLSGVARDGDERILLSEKEGKIVSIGARRGTRRVLAAAGLSALPARALASGNLAMLADSKAGAAITMVSLSGARRASIAVDASYASAFSADREGNLWVWDAGERRIRILTQEGREVYSIRPMFPASTMQLPQQLDVYDDGSFLLGGSGEVWKFANTGVPHWRLTRIPGRPSELLPAGFSLAANGTDGSFTLLDEPSRRLLSFTPGPAAADESLGSLLSRLDGRKPAQLAEAAALARGSGHFLMAWQFGDLLARRGGPESERILARVAILKQKAGLAAGLADSLARDLRYDRADVAWLRAGEDARELAAEASDDAEAAGLLQTAVSRRQEVRAALLRQPEVRVVSATAASVSSGQCDRLLVVKLTVRNDGASTLQRAAIRLSVPSISPMPSQASIGELAPGGQRVVEIRLALPGSPRRSSGPDVPAGFLITFQKGIEEISVPGLLSLAVPDAGSLGDSADALICRASPGDQLVAGLGDDLLSGAHDALPSLATILDSLGSLRARSPGGVAEVVGGRSLRAALRSLSPDERDWTIFTVSLAASFGLNAGLIAWPDRTLCLLDTGVPLAEAYASLPGLDRFSEVLTALSRNGTFCLPLSGLPPRETAGQRTSLSPTASAFREALLLCAARGAATARVLWLDPAAAAAHSTTPLPIPFPFLPPVRARNADTSRVIAAMNSALAAIP